MKKLTFLMSGIALGAAGAAFANDDLVTHMDNPGQWAIQTGDYANQRYSELDQINAENVKNLQVAWTFSTGVLRGHEGSPLVIGDTMYVHTPFPNIVYALDLSQDGKIKWKYEPKQDPNVIPVMCCDTVNRGVAYADGKIFLHQADTTIVALNADTGAVEWTAVNGDPSIGETNTATVLPVKDKIIVGISGGEFGVQGNVTAYDMKTGRSTPLRSRKDHLARQARGPRQLAQDLGRRSVEDRRRHHLGLVFGRSGREPVLLWLGQPLDLEPGAAPG
jgi:PQQ-dependent dehydrogenase (methanol/ethanol family)